MKQGLLVVGLTLAVTNVASAQGMEIHNRFGPSGTHFQLPSDTVIFNYEATICGGTEAYTIRLNVYHNGVLKVSNTQDVAIPPTEYNYAFPVNMATWGLAPGDTTTFTCTVTCIAHGQVLATDHLIGDVVAPSFRK